MKTHLQVIGIDYRSQGQSQHDYYHQTLCGYVRDSVTIHHNYVDCKLCLREFKKRGKKK